MSDGELFHFLAFEVGVQGDIATAGFDSAVEHWERQLRCLPSKSH